MPQRHLNVLFPLLTSCCYVFLLVGLSCFVEVDTALAADVFWGSDLWLRSSGTAGETMFVLRAGRAAAAPGGCEEAGEVLVSLPADPDAGPRTSLQVCGAGAVEDLAGLCGSVGVDTLLGTLWVVTILPGKVSGTGGGASRTPLEAFRSLELLSTSFKGTRTVVATAARWDATLSVPLSGVGTGELELELELDVDEGEAAAAAQSLRLSASFFSLGIPGEEQEERGVWRPSVDLQSVVPVLLPLSGVVIVEEGVELLGLSWVWTSALASDRQAPPPGLFESGGGSGLRNVSLLTEMNALPGVEKETGP